MAPKRIVILRHGEKPGAPDAPDDPSSPDLSPPGVQRAQMLATLIPTKFGDPAFIFAAASSLNSRRPVETVQPLATALRFGPDKFITTYPNGNYAGLASTLLSEAQFADKLLVVCWHHGNIPNLGSALRLTQGQMATVPEIINKHGELKWNPSVFDRFWILDCQPGPGVQFQSTAQS